MIRVTGPSRTTQPSPARKAGKAEGAFNLGEGAKGVSAAAGPSAARPVETLSALIALQSDGSADARARTLATAAQILDRLDRLRDGLLEGAVLLSDLEALAAEAARRAEAAEPGLAGVYDEIALRARVELAKLGR